MQVDNVTGGELALTPSISPGASPSAGEVGKNTFLQLLIAQLEHQNPLSPMENTEFTAQLAQFNTLEQMGAMRTNLEALVAAQEAVNRLQSADLIGKQVLARGNTLQLRHGETSQLHYTVAGNSARVLIRIVDAAGNLVHTIERTGVTAGEHRLSWDGRDAQGTALPDGNYRFTVSAEDVAGNGVPTDTLVQGIVDGIEFVDNRPFLLVNGDQVAFATVLNVTEANDIKPESTN